MCESTFITNSLLCTWSLLLTASGAAPVFQCKYGSQPDCIGTARKDMNNDYIDETDAGKVTCGGSYSDT